MRLRPQSLERRREERRAQKLAERRHRVERQVAQTTALRPRDEHTGGYGDPTYPGP
jgi:hypothetical protein